MKMSRQAAIKEIITSRVIETRLNLRQPCVLLVLM